MTGKRDTDDEDTPVQRPMRARSVSSVMTSWGIIEIWLASKPTSRMYTGRLDGRQHVMRVIDDGAIADEPVAPNEDPSAAIVRAIGKLR